MEILDNVQALTDPKIDVNKIVVLGLRLGDPVSMIPPELITENGYGWIQTAQGVTFGISAGDHPVIRSFIIKAPWVDELGIRKFGSLESKFGKPEGIEKSNGTRRCFYPSRRMQIAWEEDENEIWGIYLGDNLPEQTYYDAGALIEMYIEMIGAYPDTKDWIPERFRGDRSTDYEFQQMTALCKALGLGSAQSFAKHEFLKNRSRDDLRPLEEDLLAYIQEYEHGGKYDLEREVSRMTGMALSKFLRLLQEIRALQKFNSGWLMAGFVSSRYIITKTESVIGTINNEKVQEIKDLLSKIIDPQQRKFSQSQLIRDYGFPDVDLRAIQMDEW